ncbi:MAG: UDP-2,3-diacylglucosamine diphosphatase [Bdellovibrionales bacterium]|nr:UDP-2,3-diacylglucosamine diphosphatase [Bdellovibrionales bacterium]
MTKPAYVVFISDCHLGSRKEPRFVLFESLLNRLKNEGKVTHLFLVGDIFDLWVGRHSYFVDKYSGLVKLVHQLVQMGVEVHYFEGNHDLYLQDFWGEELGVFIHEGPKQFEIENKIFQVEHGDQMDPSDKGYIFLRWFLRWFPIRTLIRHLPEWMVVQIGEKASESSREYTSTGSKSQSSQVTIQKFYSFVDDTAQNADWDFLIAGHIHHRLQYQIPDSTKTAFNLGVWDDQPQILVWTPSKQPHFVDVTELCRKGP